MTQASDRRITWTTSDLVGSSINVSYGERSLQLKFSFKGDRERESSLHANKGSERVSLAITLAPENTPQHHVNPSPRRI
jgi:hypothetical protein